MKHELFFDAVHDYSSSDAISVPVKLRSGDAEAEFVAFVDTGATFCVFERGWGEALGLNIESGSALRFSTATGSFDAYGHALTIETLGREFDAVVYFAEHEGFRRNVLGRRGWLDQVRLGLIEHEAKLYVSRYDE